MGHRFLDFFGNFGPCVFLYFLPLLEFLMCLAILEISTRSCNAPSPNLSLSRNLSIESILFLVLTSIIVCSSLNSCSSVSICISSAAVLILVLALV